MECTHALTSFSDDELLRRLANLLGQSRRDEADLVAHIGEVVFSRAAQGGRCGDPTPTAFRRSSRARARTASRRSCRGRRRTASARSGRAARPSPGPARGGRAPRPRPLQGPVHCLRRASRQARAAAVPHAILGARLRPGCDHRASRHRHRGSSSTTGSRLDMAGTTRSPTSPWRVGATTVTWPRSTTARAPSLGIAVRRLVAWGRRRLPHRDDRTS